MSDKPKSAWERFVSWFSLYANIVTVIPGISALLTGAGAKIAQSQGSPSPTLTTLAIATIRTSRRSIGCASQRLDCQSFISNRTDRTGRICGLCIGEANHLVDLFNYQIY